MHRGVDGFAGELGYLPVYEGRYHPLEALVSRPVVNERARVLGFSDMAALFEHARLGNKAASALVAEIGSYIALGLCAVVTALNPPLIVVVGSMGRYSEVLIPPLDAAPHRFLPLTPRLAGTALGGDAALRGAVTKAMERALPPYRGIDKPQGDVVS